MSSESELLLKLQSKNQSSEKEKKVTKNKQKYTDPPKSILWTEISFFCFGQTTDNM